ncbi:coiled-coil domain-containing protein [Planktothrix paucivesiculata]|uniref:Myosin heavy chain n=1 Tax=Planktothrix paucivesiculata PCC 9631 TaxID=671071 RepID=A0A7Z9BM63_9CYAN|nr:hypothetical protein [Planktothrix paucivesiculata]VXD13843.1 conserved hypothetical protein [Planktothrix paucivesiculata PCC 9631]
MTHSPFVPTSKTQLLAAFQQILAEQKRIESKVATKEQEAEQEKGKQILETAATYTVDSIVKGLADLQLDFGSIILELTEKLRTESTKLEELNRGIEVENQHFKEIHKIRIVADALHILTQEHQEKLSLLEQNATLGQEVLQKDITTKRKIWEKEQGEFDTTVEEETERLSRSREQGEADYNYELERTRRIETDEYEDVRRKLERELLELNQEKDKNWTEREQILTVNQAEFEANQQQVAGYEEQLKQAHDQAKEEAIQEATREAKVKSDLLAKEWESNKQGYELQVQSLEQTIQRQNEQITQITTQLQETLKQAQDLAMRAFSSSTSSNTGTK